MRAWGGSQGRVATPVLTPPARAPKYAGGNTLYESAGQYGASDVREVDLESGAVRLRTPVAANVFAEGLALVGGTLLQLTWRSGAGLKYDAKTLAPAGAFTTPLPDGWGLTNGAAPDELLATDGSATLYTLDARTLALKRRVEVTHAGAPVALLNELEFVEGEVFANVWLTDCIARIDPATGAVTGWVLLQGLRPADARGGDDVLNGIAWDAARRRLFVTGKYWRRLFQIELRRLEAGRLSAAHREAAASCTRRHAGLFF